MAADESTPAASCGKPKITLDHISIAPDRRNGVSVCATITIVLDDVQALDAIMRAVGTIARARGYDR